MLGLYEQLRERTCRHPYALPLSVEGLTQEHFGNFNVMNGQGLRQKMGYNNKREGLR